MTFHELRETADGVRGISLEALLLLVGAERDRQDKAKWHTRQGVLSVTGRQFMNWTVGRGGGGAIDLAMHLHGLDFKAAVHWLRDRFALPVPREATLRDAKPPLRLPAPDGGKLSRVRRYLVHERALLPALIEPLIEAGAVYADTRANAVFLLLGKEKRPVGAELRGTTASRWRGMAHGSRKDLGYFAASALRPAAAVVLCESAIDAISCLALHPDRVCISTSGARANPRWLSALIGHGHEVYCGYDSDPTGEAMARAMAELHPTAARLRPRLHDWNDMLTSQR